MESVFSVRSFGCGMENRSGAGSGTRRVAGLEYATGSRPVCRAGVPHINSADERVARFGRDANAPAGRNAAGTRAQEHTIYGILEAATLDRCP
jgi:hypothetical protein